MPKVFGYTSSRPFGDFIMPVPAQGTCLREYARSNHLQYIIPQLEHKFENCYMQLSTTIMQMSKGDILAMYSAEMIISSIKAIGIIKNTAVNGIITHFVLENTSVIHPEELNPLILARKIREKTIRKVDLTNRIIGQ